MATRTTLTPPPPLLLITTLLLLLADAAAVRFDYATLTLSTLELLGDAHLNNNTIRLTRDLPVPTSASGRALYAAPVRLLAGFSTSFAFTVTMLNRGSVGGGLAFVVALDAASVGDARAFIGLDPAADVAVEFDTLMDLQFGDVNGNHVSVDLGSMVSAAAADLGLAGVELTSGRTVYAWIEYSPGKAMDVFVSYSAKRPAAPVLSTPVNLAGYFKEQAFVGFSASTQGSTEIHAIEWWSFSTPAPPSPAPSKPPPVAPVSAAPPPASPLNPKLPSAPQLPGITPPATPATVSAPPTSSVTAASAPANSVVRKNAKTPHPAAHGAVAEEAPGGGADPPHPWTGGGQGLF
ncbi:L-type lectin-domain containing receptor kinase VIII.2-like [Hordeum vulgare]|nr:L-type lectin-domain containing receptor kinase VIII.2-like [Hordeum vulgare]